MTSPALEQATEALVAAARDLLGSVWPNGDCDRLLGQLQAAADAARVELDKARRERESFGDF